MLGYFYVALKFEIWHGSTVEPQSYEPQSYELFS